VPSSPVSLFSIFGVIMANKLKKAGIKPEGRSVYELADGTPVEYDYGFARVSFMGAETVAQVIFGPENVAPILGVVAAHLLRPSGIAVLTRAGWSVTLT
jgi:hypothetical protein